MNNIQRLLNFEKKSQNQKKFSLKNSGHMKTNFLKKKRILVEPTFKNPQLTN